MASTRENLRTLYKDILTLDLTEEQINIVFSHGDECLWIEWGCIGVDLVMDILGDLVEAVGVDMSSIQLSCEGNI